ncbi:hypothetical protein LCGC14_0851530, partial [marine sediment metagenome]
ENIKKAALFLQQSKNAVALTGAGISIMRFIKKKKLLLKQSVIEIEFLNQRSIH